MFCCLLLIEKVRLLIFLQLMSQMKKTLDRIVGMRLLSTWMKIAIFVGVLWLIILGWSVAFFSGFCPSSCFVIMDFQIGAITNFTELFLLSFAAIFFRLLGFTPFPDENQSVLTSFILSFFLLLFSPCFFRAVNPRWVSRTWRAVRVPPLSPRSARPLCQRSWWASCTTPPQGGSLWRSSKASTSKTWLPTSHPVSTLSSSFLSPPMQNRAYGFMDCILRNVLDCSPMVVPFH